MAPRATKKPKEEKPKIPGGIKYIAISYGNVNGKKLGYVKKRPKPEEKGKVFCKFCHRMYANTNSLRGHITIKHKEERDKEEREYARCWTFNPSGVGLKPRQQEKGTDGFSIYKRKNHKNPKDVPTAWNSFNHK